MLLSLLAGAGIGRWIYKPKPIERVITVDRLERYKPGVAYQILNAPSWRLTGRIVDGVPVVEPADESTEDLARRVLGPEAEDTEFLFVGEIGRVGRAGADVFVVSPPPIPELEAPEPDTGIDLEDTDLPRATPRRQPTQLILVARPSPLFDLRTLYQSEVLWQWEPSAADMLTWEAKLRPYELWIKGRVYGFVEAGYHQRAGDSGAFGRAGIGVCPGGDC